MDKNSEEDISPQNFARLYMSMTPEQKELFWKLFAESVKNDTGNQCDIQETD